MDFVKAENFGEAPKGLKDCVFCIIFADNIEPYKHYKEVSKEVQDSVLPFALMQMRWDGKIGFPGGKVDEGESLIVAVQRELKEELGLNLPRLLFQPVSTFYNHEIATHLFEVHLEAHELLHTVSCVGPDAQIGSEVLGVILAPLYNSTHNEFTNFLQNNFSASAKLELQNFVKIKGYLAPQS